VTELLAALRSGAPLPQQVRIPTELVLRFSALWQRSSAPPYHEWGATIIETAGGALTVGDVAFAPQDIVEIVNRRMEVSIVQSGDARFLIVQRVSELKPPVNVADLEREMYDVTADAMKDREVTWQQALLAANLSVCRRLGLGFYRGEVALTRLNGGV
jgi:hypothetical protein